MKSLTHDIAVDKSDFSLNFLRKMFRVRRKPYNRNDIIIGAERVLWHARNTVSNVSSARRRIYIYTCTCITYTRTNAKWIGPWREHEIFREKNTTRVFHSVSNAIWSINTTQSICHETVRLTVSDVIYLLAHSSRKHKSLHPTFRSVFFFFFFFFYPATSLCNN